MLYHIVPRREFEAARGAGVYVPEAFAREGFVHCSYLRQLVATANRMFAGRQDLIVLEVDPSRLPARMVDENLVGGAELYPHVYGAIPLAAVTRVIALPWTDDGFVLPETLRESGGDPAPEKRFDLPS